MDVAALHLGRQTPQHVTQLLLVLFLLLGKFPGTYESLKPEIVWNHGEIHQFHSSGENDWQKAAADQPKSARSCQCDPVILKIESLFDEVNVLRLIRWGRLVEEAGGTH